MKDIEDIKLLSIFYYIIGVIIALSASIFILHFIMSLGLMGTAIFVAPLEPDEIKSTAVLSFSIAVFAITIVLAGWIIAGCIIYAGICLSKSRKYIFCFIIAGVLCLFIPLGTILGVFTIIVLMRPTVRDLFSGVPNRRSL